MKRVKKVNLIGVLGVIIACILTNNVKAASISVTADSTNITKGSTVTVTATFNSSSLLYFTEGSLSCKGAGVDSGLNLGNGQGMIDKSSYSVSLKIKPTQSGTVTCSTSGASAIEATDPNKSAPVNGSVYIQVNEPVVVPPKEYSSNNNLSSLEVEGFNLDPAFNQDTLEYNVEVPNDTAKVNIKAELADNTASVRGNGEITVTEGVNKLEVIVTAENGNEKKYVINLTVKELDPINVKVNKDDYSIVRKEGVIEAPTGYEKTTIKVDDQDVLAYQNKKTGYTIVGLKDKDGNTGWYIYDEKKKTYTPYEAYDFKGLNIIILDMPKNLIPSGYTKSKFTYNDKKITGYASKDGSPFYLIYGMNSETGKKNLYIFDKQEGTVQRYNTDLVDNYKNKANFYFTIMIILASLVGLAIVIMAVCLIVKTKRGNRKRIGR